MDDPDRRFHFVHILPAFAAAAISADFEVGWIDFDWCALGNLRNDVNAGKGSVPAFVSIERGDANKADVIPRSVFR